ncbi:MAG: HAD-IIIC family phosphatase [Steroidobacteraceae bacterium]
MNVKDALTAIRSGPRDGKPFNVRLACGFTPLHLSTLLNARLQLAFPTRKVTVEIGVFGDLLGTIKATDASSCDALCVVLEYGDLDPRLGYREARRWGPAVAAELADVVAERLQHLANAVVAAARTVTVAIAGPTLQPAPLFHTTPWQASSQLLAVEREIANCLNRVGSVPGIAVANSHWLRSTADAAPRHDIRSDLVTGFPYSVAHADRVAECLGALVAPPMPRKGLITDLDDTLWSGIVGDVGEEAVSWDLAAKTHHHALFQTLLAALSEEGVLLAIASKNSAEVAAGALHRPDMLVDPSKLFPQEINWNAKSLSVGRILSRWNIGPEAVVFVDDSEYELAEVKAAYPQIECVQFPTRDPDAVVDTLWDLRRMFGRQHLSAEDALRSSSIRQAAKFELARDQSGSGGGFLANVDALIEFDFRPAATDKRSLELVNKTNQFNLNGTRLTESDWRQMHARTNAWSVVVSYTDRFGPLGKVAVLAGVASDGNIRIETWVLSCRAFSRQIEQQCLRALFMEFPDIHTASLSYGKTPRNGPIKAFLDSLGIALDGSDPMIFRDKVEDLTRSLPHRVNIRSRRNV